MTILIALPLLGGCATDPYTGRPDIAGRTMGGALLGAAAGALAVGHSPVEGAAAGLVVGGALGAGTAGVGGKRHHYYRDTRGYCYYIDQNGQAHYAPAVRC
jgi:hypothetical protein